MLYKNIRNKLNIFYIKNVYIAILGIVRKVNKMNILVFSFDSELTLQFITIVSSKKHLSFSISKQFSIPKQLFSKNVCLLVSP